MLNPIPECRIDNFILIKYSKESLDAPKHIKKVNMRQWNKNQQFMFDTMVEQLNFFYPLAKIHVLTNEKHEDFNNLIWHYHPELESNHNSKLLLYGLLDEPAMYIDNDILINKPFKKKHLATESPFNLYRLSTARPLQSLARKKLDVKSDKQYNCGMIWIPRPSRQIVAEMQEIKKKYFNDRKVIEGNSAWFNNDEHPVSYFIARYGMKMKLFKDVNVFRSQCEYENIFKVQSIHYTGVRSKNKFMKEYKEICKARIFS
jgi:hypothetical protein